MIDIETNVKIEQTMRYHLSRTLAGDGSSTMCECPQWKIGVPCVHEKYLNDYGHTMYPIGPITSKRYSCFIVVYLIVSQSTRQRKWTPFAFKVGIRP